ncbi:hypothetical protein MIND_00627000 [Mycena indigotica]|uniref:Uncharacterized protein n=1 Tax=Mycena indigotica TaxID=2126181 RepID=A0A8H6W3V5_9AGAR|nr:uncharacterized protein MIND_00627000 [Mycena indigotica]KAF7303962.1 hypothetical protein MIND_00627000 [Mycena indigotica]
MSLPTELVWAILHQIEDIQSLQSCSLASSHLRIPAQQALFTDFKIPTLRAAACDDFLRDAPHIVGYITSLRIELRVIDLSLEDTKTYGKQLTHILSRFGSVRQCYLDGSFDVPTLLVDNPFILSQLERLCPQELHIHRLRNIPSSLFQRLARIAPRLSFSTALLADHRASEKEYDVEQLNLWTLTDPICRFFANARLPQLVRLRLDVNADINVDAFKLVENCAETLQSLTFMYSPASGTHIPPRPLPILPTLLHVTFFLRFQDRGSSWFQETATAILSPSTAPSLRHATIAYIPTYTPFSCPPYIARDHLLPLLDAVLSRHPVRPRLRWVLNLITAHCQWEHANETAFNVFADGLKMGMPVMQRERRLEFEKVSSRK